MKNKRNILSSVLMLLILAMTLGCVRPADAQYDLLQTKTLKGGDSVMTVYVAPFEEPQIWLSDSSNSRNDTITIYIGSPDGGTLGAVVSPLNDTGIVYPANESNTTLILTDGALTGYALDVTRPYSIIITCKGISTKRTKVTVTAKKRTTGALYTEPKHTLAYWQKELRYYY